MIDFAMGFSQLTKPFVSHDGKITLQNYLFCPCSKYMILLTRKIKAKYQVFPTF